MNTKQRNKDVLKIEMLWLSKKHTAETQKTERERERKKERQNKRERRQDEQPYSEKVRHCIDVG